MVKKALLNLSPGCPSSIFSAIPSLTSQPFVDSTNIECLLCAQKWGNKTSRGMIDIFKNYINIELHIVLSIM